MRWTKYAIAIVLLITVAYATFFVTTPAAVRAYYWNRSLLERAVQAQAEPLDEERSQRLGADLANAGFTSIRRQGDCTLFYHSGHFAAIDSWHEIVHSPAGFRGLPSFRIGERNTLDTLRRLDGDGYWFYARHD